MTDTQDLIRVSDATYDFLPDYITEICDYFYDSAACAYRHLAQCMVCEDYKSYWSRIHRLHGSYNQKLLRKLAVTLTLKMPPALEPFINAEAEAI